MTTTTQTLESRLDELDQGAIAGLIGDAKIIELIETVQIAPQSAGLRGSIILSVLGGPAALLANPKRRLRLIESLSKNDRQTLETTLKVPVLRPFRLTGDRRKNLFAFFGVDDHESLQMAKTGTAVRIQSVAYGLFPHQSKVLFDCYSHLKSQTPRVMLHMPTGTGKTRTAMHLACRHFNQHRNTIVIWLVAGLELCEQAAHEFEKAWQSLGERYLPVIRLWGSRSDIDAVSIATANANGHPITPNQFSPDIWNIQLSDAMIVANIDSVYSLLQAEGSQANNLRSKHVSLIIFDEAHRAVAHTYQSTIGLLSNSKTALLGLSATPGRHHHGKSANDDISLVQQFGKNKVVLDIPGFSSPIEALIAQGYLAKLELERLEIAAGDLTPAEVSAIRKHLAVALDLTPQQLQYFGLKPTRLLQIVERAARLVQDEGHKRVIIFAPSLEASDIMSNLLKSRGINSASITSKSPTSIREAKITEYKVTSDQRPMILCNFAVLTAGFDSPHTSSVIIARPTSSIVLLSQMAGRALRGPKVGGNSTAKLITVVDTEIPELVQTVNQFHAFDTSWNQGT